MLLAMGEPGQLESAIVGIKKEVTLTTDGACIGNPGAGGWACLLRFGQYRGEMFGHDPATTNNRMELQAVIEGLKALKEPCAITVRTDSQYVQRGVTQWLAGWKANGWKKTRNSHGSRAVLNQELWVELDKLLAPHTVSWKWIKGHADDEDNLRCDALANRAARDQISSEGILRTVTEDQRRVV